MEDQTLLINHRICHVFGRDKSDFCIICGMDARAQAEIRKTAEFFYQMNAAAACCLVLFETTDWNGDFSPWTAAPVFGTQAFAGNAQVTLAWITEALLPQLLSMGNIQETTKKYLAGYSLSGLFALWGFLESGLFDGAASCSGSLWFPGWMEYMETHAPDREGVVYLSLGSKEEQTKHASMAVVGDYTRNSYHILKTDRQIQKVVLEWNPGGHFANPTERLIKGLRWLLEQSACLPKI